MRTTSSPRTAILQFRHRSAREGANKQFVPHDVAKSRGVAGALGRHTRAAVAQSGLPVVDVPTEKQRGTDFGARLANALADAFAAGYERLIVVGSDCPRLHEVNWSDVASQLETGTSVLGPTPERDGTYLIGLTRQQFDAEAFAALPWQSAALFEALAQYLTRRSGTPPTLLAPRGDVNGSDDLVALLQDDDRLPADLAAAIRQVLGPARPAARVDRLVSRDSVRRHRSRAPPSFLSCGIQ